MRAALLLVVIAASCARYSVAPYPVQTCIRYVGEDGYLYGRTVTFAGAQAAAQTIKVFPYSHYGACVDGEQAQNERVDVCLVASSPCAHDRTTNVWFDQKEAYFKRYPGSYEGKCTSECSKHKDDCIRR